MEGQIHEFVLLNYLNVTESSRKYAYRLTTSPVSEDL